MTESDFLATTIKEVNGVKLVLINESGILGTSDSCTIKHNAFNVDFEISIAQNVARFIEIKSITPTRVQYFWNVLHDVIRLCMLFEGEFLQIQSIDFFIDEEKAVWSDELCQEYSKRTLPIYSSADFIRGSSKYLCALNCLTDELLNDWINIENELQIIHPMVLYGMSSLELPVDLKAAFLIESFEHLYDLIKQYNPHFTIAPRIIKPDGGKDSKLRRILESTILQYGRDIFEKEIEKDIHEFCQILVNSRNRMFHIFTLDNKLVLSGSESILYAAKLSFLYRRVLLDLLRIDYALYKDNLKNNISRWNSWEGVLDFFLATKWTD